MIVIKAAVSKKSLKFIFFGILALLAVFMLVYADNQRSAFSVTLADNTENYGYTEYNGYEADNFHISLNLEDIINVEPQRIFVYISGEVYSPGVFSFYEGDRVVYAIEAAGGFTQYANRNAINLAAHLFDTQHIVVHHIEAGVPSNINQTQANSLQSEQENLVNIININTATAEQLTALSGVGPSLSQRIVAHREARGNFYSIDEIKNVSGIGDSIFENIRNFIIVD